MPCAVKYIARLSACSSVLARCASTFINIITAVVPLPANFARTMIFVRLRRAISRPAWRVILTRVAGAFVYVDFTIGTVESCGTFARVRINTIGAVVVDVSVCRKVVPKLSILVDGSLAWIRCAVVDVFTGAVDAITNKATLAFTLVHARTYMRTVRIAVTVVHEIVILA